MANNAKKLFDKVKYIIGIDDLEDEYYEEEEVISEIEVPQTKQLSKNNRILNIHSNNNVKLVIHEPKKFEDSTKIVDDLRNRKPVIINLQVLEGEDKRKVFDFLNGALYTLDGNIQKVAKDIFILGPNNVEIDGDLKEELKNRGIFPWQK